MCSDGIRCGPSPAYRSVHRGCALWSPPKQCSACRSAPSSGAHRKTGNRGANRGGGRCAGGSYPWIGGCDCRVQRAARPVTAKPSNQQRARALFLAWVVSSNYDMFAKFIRRQEHKRCAATLAFKTFQGLRFFGANPNAAKEDLDESKHTPGQDGGVSFIEVPCNPEVTASSDSVPSSTFSTARLSVSTGDAPKEPAATNPQSTANMRGADARLIAETNQVWTPRLVLFNELEKPMKELGAGEFCRAHLSKLDGRDVVVKMLKPEQRNNPTAVKDLLSEGALMMAMQHPNLLGAIAHGLDDYGLPFVVIEKLETVLSAELPKLDDSVPIWTRQAQVKKWPLTRALRTGLELAEALHYCHTEVATSVFPGCRILHRDLKPNNIGFLPDGRLALFDFGLAKLWRISADDLDGSETRLFTGNTGSLRYMAPEVALSKPYSHKAEVFAFATVLWEMASHERPYSEYDVKGFYKCAATPRLPSRSFCRTDASF